MTDLQDTPLVPGDTFTVNFRFKTYQVPPQIGSHTTLYLGGKNNFLIPYTLLRLGDLSFLNDSLTFVDSAYLQLTIDESKSDTIVEETGYLLSHMELDSNYSESNTNYTNDDWVNLDSPPILSTFVQDTVDTLTWLNRIRFDIDPSLVHTLADTVTPERLFILETEDSTYIQSFYSSESGENAPFLKVFYHYSDPAQGDSIIDSTRTIPLSSDVSIIEPPLLKESFDPAYSYLSFGGGIRTLLVSDADSLNIPSEAVIIRANLILKPAIEKSQVTSLGDFRVGLFGLNSVEDTLIVDSLSWGEMFVEDPYSDITFSGLSSIATEDSTLTLDAKNILQSLVIGNIQNLGFKLLTSSSKSIFDLVALYSSSDNAQSQPVLEVLYEAP